MMTRRRTGDHSNKLAGVSLVRCLVQRSSGNRYQDRSPNENPVDPGHPGIRSFRRMHDNRLPCMAASRTKCIDTTAIYQARCGMRAAVAT